MKTRDLSRKIFYDLNYPCDRPHQIYGHPGWERRFGPAEWSRKVGGLSPGRLTMPYGEPRVDLTIILPSSKIGDFTWTWYSDCIVTERTLSLFTQAGFTGFQARPVTVEKVKGVSRKQEDKIAIPPLWELPINGKGGDAAPESGIYPLYEIRDTGTYAYSSFRNGIIVDKANWDGSDFFTVNGYPRFILVTERVKELIIANELTNCTLIPSHKLEWGSGKRPEDGLEETSAMASRSLGSLLADLQNPDVLMDTIDALGHKGDPTAVDALIKRFDHPDPSIWYSAASSVAAIAQHRNTSEQVSNEIFLKLISLFDHDDPAVRETAALAVGYVGGERSAKEVMKLLNDRDEYVRDKAIFVLGLLHYTAALDAVQRLTRDKSKRVRETARRVSLELSSEIA